MMWIVSSGFGPEYLSYWMGRLPLLTLKYFIMLWTVACLLCSRLVVCIVSTAVAMGSDAFVAVVLRWHRRLAMALQMMVSGWPTSLALASQYTVRALDGYCLAALSGNYDACIL